jgi:hypothetical protein
MSEQELRQLIERARPSDERLEDALASTTGVTVTTGAATIGMEIMNLLTEGEVLGMLARTTGNIFGGLVWVDISLSIYLLYRKMKRQRDDEPRVIVEVPGTA